MASVIKIKRSGSSGAPGTLKLGEMAYSYLSYNGSNGGDRLYIGAGGVDGSGNANDIITVGGKYFTDLLGGAANIAGTLTASKAIIVDANKKIDNLLVDNLDLNGNTLSTTNTNGDLVLSPNGNGAINASSSVISNVTTPSNAHEAANKAYVDSNFIADAGGTMSGDLAMGSNNVTGLGAPSNAGDAARKSYVDTADALKLNLAGGTMSGAIAMGTAKITGMGDPTSAQDAATKAYVDTVSGATTLTFKGDSAGTDTVDLDTDTLSLLGGNVISTRKADNALTIDLDNTAVTAGSYGSATAIPTFTVDAQGRLTAAGSANVSSQLNLVGDSKSGNVSLLDSALSITGGEGINVTIDSSGVNGSGFVVAAEEATSANKGVASFASADFTVTSGAVVIAAGGVSNAQLAGSIANGKLTNSTITAAGNSGSNAIDLGDTLTISGANSTAAATQTQPVTTSQSGDTLTITARKASTTVIGMASFAAADFGVSSGAVTIKNGGVSNDQLAGSIANAKLVNPDISVTDGSTASDISLGGTLTFAAGEGIDVAQSGGTVTYSGEDASTSNKGVASFSSDNFSVSSGAVTIKNGGVNADELAGTLDLSGKSVTLANSEISNAELANSSVTINSNSLSLGGSLTLDTDDIGEGSSNLYFTTGRVTTPARAAVSVTDAGGDGSLAYNNSTGVFTYTGPSAAEVRAHHTAGTGVAISNGAISIGQAVATTSNVTFNDLQVDGNAVVDGNLTVHGTTTTINSATVTTNDPLFNLADSNLSSDALDIGFIGKYYDTGQSRIERTGLFRDASDGQYKLFSGLYDDSGTLDSATNVVDISGTGFTYANLRVGTLTASSVVGGYSGFDSDFGAKSTSDLSEGTNLYFTNERVDDRVNALITDGEGITTTYDDGGGTLTIAAEDATVSNKGVASFATANFTVSSGAVSSKDITFGSGSGTAAGTLGETITIAGGTGMATTATGTTVTVAGTNAAADGSTKGIASFNATHFSASTGNISAKDITLTSGDDQNGAGSGIAATIGESFNIYGDFSQGIQTNITSGNLIVTGRNATASSKGVVSFSTAADSAGDGTSVKQFTITSGDVALTTVDGGSY